MYGVRGIYGAVRLIQGKRDKGNHEVLICARNNRAVVVSLVRREIALSRRPSMRRVTCQTDSSALYRAAALFSV